jgi:hypothetical protein
MTKITQNGLIKFAENMAERLVDLQLRSTSYGDGKYLSGNTLEAISRHCPNLEGFLFSWSEPLPKESIIELVRNCPKLKRLAIKLSRAWSNPEDNMMLANQLQVEALQFIIANAHNLRHFVYAVPFALLQVFQREPVYDRLHEKIEKFELLSDNLRNLRYCFSRNKGDNWY